MPVAHSLCDLLGEFSAGACNRVLCERMWPVAWSEDAIAESNHCRDLPCVCVLFILLSVLSLNEQIDAESFHKH